MAKATDFTLLRHWWFERGEEPTLNDLRANIEDVIEAASLNIRVQTSNKEIFIVGNNSEYMKVPIFATNDKGTPIIAMAVEGKGQQIKAQELAQYFMKSAGAMSRIRNGLIKSGALIQSFRIGGAAFGVGASVNMAVRGSVKLIAKGVKALLRDKAAYDKEIAFYNLAMGLGDYVIGGIDSCDLIPSIVNNAENGQSIAQYVLGIAYAEGRGLEYSEDKALECFESAAAGGELRSQNIVSGEWLYGNKDYGINKKELGVKYLMNLADAGEEWAPRLLLDIFGQGTVPGIPIDVDKTMELAEKYAEKGNIYSEFILAQACDSSVSNDCFRPFNNDIKAASLYQKIINHGDNEYIEISSLRLAEMYASGQGVSQNIQDAIECYRIASNIGSLKAKAELIDAYTFGYGVEKSRQEAKKLSDEIIGSSDKEYLPVAYYSSYKFADEEEEYGESIKQARQYLACENVDPEKCIQLEKYLADMEEKISQMTVEERREFLKEPKKFSMNSQTIKWIVIGCAIILAIIVGIAIFNHYQSSHGNAYSGEDYDYTDEDTAVPDAQQHPEEAASALAAYNDLLTGGTFDRNGFDAYNEDDSLTEEWNPENCKFNVVYIDDDDIPELVLDNQMDSDHASGWGQIYTYENGQIVSATRVTSFDGTANVIDEEEGYYAKTGYYTDFAMWQGYGSLLTRNINDPDDTISMNYEPSDDSEVLVGYSIGAEECTEEEYYNRLEEMVGGAEFTPYELYENTDGNRERVLGISENSDVDSYNGENATTISNEEEAVE